MSATRTPSSRPISSRPNSSRPMSSRPVTGMSTGHETILLAISESRGPTTELGIASLNLRTGDCNILQFNDSANYSLALAQIQILNPSKIILSTTTVQVEHPSRFYQALGTQMEEIGEVLSVSRKSFSDLVGLEMYNGSDWVVSRSIVLKIRALIWFLL